MALMNIGHVAFVTDGSERKDLRQGIEIAFFYSLNCVTGGYCEMGKGRNRYVILGQNLPAAIDLMKPKLMELKSFLYFE
jgi:hypothetical protein